MFVQVQVQHEQRVTVNPASPSTAVAPVQTHPVALLVGPCPCPSPRQAASSPQTIGKASGTGGGPAVAATDREADAGSPSGVKSRSQEDGLCPGCGGEGRPDRDPPAADNLPGRSVCQTCRSNSEGRDQHGVGVGTETGAGAADGDGDGDVLRVVPGAYVRDELAKRLTFF